MYVGLKVRCKIDDSDYRLKAGDTGVIVDYKEKGENSFIICEWEQRKRKWPYGGRDLGWWIQPQKPLPDGKPINHVISNLDIESPVPELPDTREYLELITTLA